MAEAHVPLPVAAQFMELAQTLDLLPVVLALPGLQLLCNQPHRPSQPRNPGGSAVG